jgi:hypothetical protein
VKLYVVAAVCVPDSVPEIAAVFDTVLPTDNPVGSVPAVFVIVIAESDVPETLTLIVSPFPNDPRDPAEVVKLGAVETVKSALVDRTA